MFENFAARRQIVFRRRYTFEQTTGGAEKAVSVIFPHYTAAGLSAGAVLKNILLFSAKRGCI